MAGFTATAAGNREQVRYVVETTPGVTPTTPQMIDLRMTNNTLTTTRNYITSNEIRSDRNRSASILVSEDTTGEHQFELSAREYDPFWESGFQGVFDPTTGILKNGTTRKSFTIEKAYTDIGKFERFRGCEVGQIALTINSEQIVTGSFTFLGWGSETATVALDSTPTPSTTNKPMNASYSVTSMTIDGVEYEDGIQSISFATNNNLRAQRAIANEGGLSGVGDGSFDCTGTIEAYFKDATDLEDAFNNDETVDFAVTIAQDGKSYILRWPALQLTGYNPQSGGINTDVQLSLPFTATYDGNTGCTMMITRNPV